MSNKIKLAVKTAVAGAAFSLVSTSAWAVGAVGGNPSTLEAAAWAGGDNVLGAGESISTISKSFGSNNSWTDNEQLLNSAWGHAVTWFQFQVTAANQTVTLTDRITPVVSKTTGLPGSRASAFTVWTSGATPFDGGVLYGEETNNGSASGNAPHSFNAVGQLGSAGNAWIADPSYTNPVDKIPGASNLLRTLAYVNSGNAHTDPALNDWNEVIAAGVNQVDGSGNYFSGAVTGATGPNFAELTFRNLAVGWYTVAIGGANSASQGSADHVFSVAAVPVPGAVYLFGSALAGLIASSRRKQSRA